MTSVAHATAPQATRRVPHTLGNARRRRRWAWPLATVVVLAVALLAWRAIRARGARAIAVPVVRVERGSVRDFVTSVASGRVSGYREATLRAEIAGAVRTLHHRRGDRVKAGEPLISYDSAELRERLRAAEAATLVARAQALQAEQTGNMADLNARRAERLHTTGSLPLAELESLQAQARALGRAAEAARAAHLQSLANVDLARTALLKTVVRAPFESTVLSTSIEVGETTVPGTPILAVADLSRLHVDAEIDEADVGRVAVGMPVDVSVDAFPKDHLRGSVQMIPPSVTRDAHGGRSVAIEVALPPDPRLLVGMSADIDVIVAVHDNALWVPPNAVLGRGAERSVYVVSDGIAHKRRIDVGISTWEAVEVKSGVEGGDEVIATLLSTQLADGARVEPRSVAATAGTSR